MGILPMISGGWRVHNDAARRFRSTGVPPVNLTHVQSPRGMGILPMIPAHGQDARATSGADQRF
jgi:hypothetical protein